MNLKNIFKEFTDKICQLRNPHLFFSANINNKFKVNNEQKDFASQIGL